MTPAQCKAARLLLDWSARELSRRADVSVPTVLNFEAGSNVTLVSHDSILNALKRAGVGFEGGGDNPKAHPIEIRLDDGSRVFRLRACD